MSTYLEIKWTVSRGRDTYGYNICTIWDGRTPYRCNGGGYDMLGTSFGMWLTANYAGQLLGLKPHHDFTEEENRRLSYRETNYGLFRSKVDDHLYLDGACGIDCMIEIAKKLGLSVKRTSNRKGHTIGLIVEKVSN